MHFDHFSTSLLTDDVARSTAFYVDLFGFETIVDIGWFVSLKANDGAVELCIIQRDHATIPAGFHHPASGVVLAFMVTDAAAEQARLQEAGTPVVMALRDEPWGQRHFFVTDPAGVLIDLVQTIEPSAQWMADHGLA
jgi:catechol 2,3-dioxygenase-like lactoylglutathione lyase family enzyme